MSSSVNKNSTGGLSSFIAAAKAAAAAAAAAAKKAAEAAAKKAAEAAAKKAAAAAAKRKDGFEGKDLKKLTKDLTSSKTKVADKLGNGKGVATLNKDGSQTNTVTTNKKGTQTTQELTTSKNKLGETRFKFEETRTTGNRETKSKLSSEKDLFGRTSSSQSKETAIKKGDTTRTESRQTDTDKYGNKKVTTGKSTSVETGDTTKSHGTSTSKGAFGTKQTVVEDKVAVKNGNATTTTTTKSTTGTDFALSSSRELKDGKFTLKDSADWKKNSFNKETSKEKEWKLKEPTADKGFSQTTNGKLDKAQKIGDVLGEAGLKKTWEGAKFDTTGKPATHATPNSEFVGSRVGTRGESSLSIGAGGVEAKFKREAVAGLYAEKSHEVDGSTARPATRRRPRWRRRPPSTRRASSTPTAWTPAWAPRRAWWPKPTSRAPCRPSR